MIETLLSWGASACMIRLYSGMYVSVSGLASAMPWSISGTKFLGSLTNFFTFAASIGCRRSRSRLVVSRGRRAIRPPLRERLEHDGDGDGAGVQGADAALAGVRGAAALGDHLGGGLGPVARGDRRRPQHLGRRVPGLDLLLEDVHGRLERVEQGLVAEVGLAARLDPGDRRPQHRDQLVAVERGHRAGGGARAQERGAPDRARGAADAAGDHDRDLLEEGADVGPVEPVPALEHQLEAAGHRVAEVAVADDRVEVAEVLLVRHRRLGDRAHDRLHVREIRIGHARSLLHSRSGSRPVRSASVIWSPGGGAGLWLAMSTVGSPPLSGSPSDETTIAASAKSSPAVISLTVTRQVSPAPTAARCALRDSS